MIILKRASLITSLVILIISCNSNHSKKESKLLAMATNQPKESPCSVNGIELYGKVKFVESFPDLKIKYVSSFANIKVKFVNSFADDCGEWQIVESFPDFTVQVVESFPDLEVEIVDSFPGMD